jgi:alpha-ketoglutarate-dependent taurine dioxygenase
LTKDLDSKLDELGMRMQWEQGDFMISDNLGLVHYASGGTQADWSEVGLRILHRTTIAGGPETIPKSLDGKCSFRLE